MKKVFKITLIVFGILAVMVISAMFYFNVGEEVYPIGILPGNKAPEFAGVDQNGHLIKLSEKVKSGQVVLLFYRGFWCPSCKKHLKILENNLNEFKQKGASIIAIIPDLLENTRNLIDVKNEEISIINDKGYGIMKKYQVDYQMSKGSRRLFSTLGISIPDATGDNTYTLPVPAIYVIDKKGIIKKSWVSEGGLSIEYPSTNQIMSFLNDIGKN